MNNNELEKHSGILLANEVKQIAHPLFKVGLNYFSYVRVERNQDYYFMATHEGWAKKYLQEKYYNLEISLTAGLKELNYPKLVILWDTIKHDKNVEILKKAAAEFELGHVFSIVEIGVNFYNVYFFSAPMSHEFINQFYCNNIDMLNAFISYFKEKLHEKGGLLRIPQTKIIINKDNKNLLKLSLSISQRKELYETIRKNKLLVSESPEMKYLTLRELEVISGLLQGYSALQTAQMLKISKRTAEEHINNIKQKLSCTTLFQLGNKLAKILPEGA